MQWIQLLLWLCLTRCAAQRTGLTRLWPWVISAGLLLSMGTQLFLLAIESRLTLGVALPLHLCAMMAVLTIPMLICKSRTLYAFSLFLGVPCALLALVFPAIASSRYPFVMAAAFFRLHVLIICGPVFLWLRGFALPQNPRPILLIANAYLLMVVIVNRLLGTNFLFLQNPPLGTPLQWLAARGGPVYLCALELLALLLLTALSQLVFPHLAQAYHPGKKANGVR